MKYCNVFTLICKRIIKIKLMEIYSFIFNQKVSADITMVLSKSTQPNVNKIK